MYRKFYLKNNTGSIYNLTDGTAKTFMGEISGLGYTKTVAGNTIGDVINITSSTFNFPQITGTLHFYAKRDVAYQNYFDFIKFASLDPLKLYYLPPNTLVPYFCNVELIQVDKGEYSYENKSLDINLVFSATSHWQNSQETVIEMGNATEGTGKYYDLVRPYYYAGSVLSKIQITNSGSDAVGMLVEVTGDVTNPQWTLTQNDSIYGTCKINGSYDVVKVDSKDGEQEIYLEKDSSIIPNPAVYQDLTVTGGVLTFVKLKTGVSIMNFTCGNIDTFDGTVKITFASSFISV